MKKTLLLIFVLGSFAVNAQTYSISPARTVTFSAPLNNITLNDIYQQNTGTSTLSLTWEKISITAPAQWQFSMCDLGTCHSNVPQGPTTMSIVAVNGAGFLGINVDPGNTAGSGIVKVRVYQTGSPANADTLTWYISATVAGVREYTGNNALSVHPNPATSQINFALHNGEEIISGEIKDAIGRTVLTINASSTQVNISELPKGIYFLHMATASHNYIKRIVKE
jgi:hypothetical protein